MIPAQHSASIKSGRRLAVPSAATSIFLILLLIVAVFAAFRFQSFASVANLKNICTAASILLVMAVGATFVIVTAGVDLSVGAVLVFSGVVADKVMAAAGGQGWRVVLLGFFVAAISGAAWGVINGTLIARARVPPLITTLGTLGAAQGLALIISEGVDLKDVPDVLGDTLGIGDFLGVPWLVIIAVVIAAIGGAVLAWTRFGRHTFAIGSNAAASREMGINVTRHLVIIYALAGLLAGIAGMLSLARYGSTTISGHTTDNLSVIAAVVIGGTSLFGGAGGVFGTAIGVLIPAVLDNGLVMIGLESFWRDVIVGVVLIAAVYLDQLGRRARAGR
jgi:ribose transport system permease protein